MTAALAVDVVVIGAGIAGASAAAELSKRARVVLLERERLPAMHASGRSASVLSETSGHPLVCGLAHVSRPFFEAPPAGFVDHPLLTPRGLVWVGEAGDEALLDELAQRSRHTSPTSRRLTTAQARRRLPSFTATAVAAGAVDEPDAMSIDTAALIEGYLRVLRRNGGTIATGAEAVRLARQRGGWDVETPSGSWQADHVVDAAGAWADVVAGRAGVTPIGLLAMRRTAAIAPAPDTTAGWPLVMDIAGRYYCEPEPGGLLISPADETVLDPCDAQPEELDVALALERVGEATGLPLRSIRRAWAGLRTFAPDRAPVLGEDPTTPGFWWLAGQGGAGIKTAPAMAQLLAASVEGRPWPAAADAVGVTPNALGPGRFSRSAR